MKPLLLIAITILAVGCVGIKKEVEVPHEIQEALKSDS